MVPSGSTRVVAAQIGLVEIPYRDDVQRHKNAAAGARL